MRRQEQQFASPKVLAASVRLGRLVRTARLARNWTQRELAERARVSIATLRRIESGAVEASLGAWLAAFESLGLLPLFTSLDDPSSRALLEGTQAKRSRRRRDGAELDF
jgi:transcriptional regulator with XRE-family HTH domain